MDNPTQDTLTGLFLQRAHEQPAQPALLFAHRGEYSSITWQQLADAVFSAAASLRGRGVQPGDPIVQIAENCPQWIICDLAIMLVGAVHVPLHAALSPAQIAQQIAHSGARLVLYLGSEQGNKFNSIADRLEAGTVVANYGPIASDGHTHFPVKFGHKLSTPAASAESQPHRDSPKFSPTCLATILYTSGTTGEPKGVMLSHNNLVSNTLGVLEAFAIEPNDVRLSFLPWSHIFARTCDLYTWIASGSMLAIAESREKLLDNCAHLQPTLINGVPYFYDKVFRVLSDRNELDCPGALLKLLGGRVRFCCSGGAALPSHIDQLFQRQKVVLTQGYGLTETSPVISVCPPSANKIGSVGPPIRDVEVRIAPDGEIVTRGPHVMAGYLENKQATADVIRDGWFHTGDLGEIDDDGYLRITGRKKDLIVLATGKNIAPVQMENLLTEDPLILQAIVVGDGRNYPVALIVPDPDVLRAEISSRKIRVLSRAHALKHRKVHALFAERIEQCLAELPSTQQIRRFKVLDRGFTVDNGEMTPTMKPRRNVIQANLCREIEALYEAE